MPRKSKLCDWCSFRAYCPAFGGTPPAYGKELALNRLGLLKG
jgi:putative RecB family exonuclease